MPRQYFFFRYYHIDSKCRVLLDAADRGYIKGLTLLIYLVLSEINRYNQPYQIISRIVKYQAFVIDIINLL